MKKHLLLAFVILVCSLSGMAQTMPIVPSTGSLCVGSTMHLTDTTSGGTWSSSNPSVATVGSTSGILSAVAVGTVTVTYIVGSSSVTGTYTVSSTPAPIAGSTHLCPGSLYSIYLTDATPGGTWSSSTTTVATIGASSGLLTGVAAGITTVYYTVASCSAPASVSDTVLSSPAAITGGTSPICIGAMSTLADATSGGTWSSGSTGIATVGSTTGVVTGVSSGNADIYYTTSAACPAYVTVTISGTPSTGTIAGPSTVCVGSTITLTDSVTSGGGTSGLTETWSSSSTSIATVGSSTGIVTGIAPGTVTITLTTTGSCGSSATTATITVSGTTSPGTISGPTSVAAGAPITLTESVSGGTWSSSSTSVATVGSSSGIVIGVAPGTATIEYTVTGCGGTAYTSTTVTVTAFSGISGYVHFATWVPGTVRLYLITYNPSTLDLEAVDSLTEPCTGSSTYYQFTGLSTDSFRVKAWGVNDSMHLPTYHDSSFYWDSADVIYYTAGSAATNEDIYMLTGFSTAGTGFVSGNVTTGANRGTSGGIAVVGLNMFIVNSTTNQLIGMATTDASGNYSFSNLPVGQTYTVFPDSLNFITTPYTNITLTSSSSSMTAASFIEHTISKTITPILENVPHTNTPVSFVTTAPNPTSGSLKITWNMTATEQAQVDITDISGREVINTSVSMNQGSGVQQLDLSALADGPYIITIKSTTLSYTNKIQVQH